jgi:glycosyltransferase involved in cell wall biosynthesis
VRIALVIYDSLEKLSGGYLYDRRMVDALHAAGHSVEVLALPWRSWPRHLADNLSRTWLARLVAAAPDLYLQDELNHPSLAWINGRLRARSPAPIVGLVHHLRCEEPHPAPLRMIYERVERRFLRSCDGFLCNSRTTLQAVARLLGCEPAALQHLVAYPGGDHIVVPDGPGLRKQPGAAGGASAGVDAPVEILFVGTLLPRKGVHTLLDAVARARQPVRLTVVGSSQADPGYAQSLRAQAVRLGLAERVTFTGALGDDALRSAYARADLFACPSFEGYGIVYLEAMAHGLPVIASSAGAAHEVVTAGSDGLLVAPHDVAGLATAIDTLAADATVRAAMAAAARRRFARQPTWSESGAAVAAWLPTVRRLPQAHSVGREP